MIDPISDVPPGALASAFLAPYQKEARDYLLSHRKAQLWVGMGLGKTVVTLDAFDTLRGYGEGRRMLVVAPLRVATLTWPHEVGKFYSHLNIAYVPRNWAALTDPRWHILTVNYEQLPNLAKRMQASCDVIPFDIVVYDEATKAKGYHGPRSKGGERIKAWLRATDHLNFRRWSLTGTPIPNSYLELWGQVALLDPVLLGRSWTQYRDTLFDSDYMGWEWTLKKDSEAYILEKIKPFTLVQKSSDYLDVADTVLEDIELTLSDEARGIYRALETELIATLYKTDKDVVAANRAVLVGKLLQLTGGAMYDNDKIVQEIDSTKVDAVVKLVKKMPKENILIFCAYKHEYSRLAKALGPSAEVFGEHLDQVERWNKGMIRYLIAHPASAGHGLNLQDGGRTIVWFTLPHSRESYDQANARLCRRGQVQVPLIYRLLTKDTIDEAVAETLRCRGKVQNELLDVVKNLKEMRS
jgi:SNF2 family DNA or RNA helicase